MHNFQACDYGWIIPTCLQPICTQHPQAKAMASMTQLSTDVGMRPTSRPPAKGRRERPCDGCRRRKGRCVPVEGQIQCAACAVHNQECTYIEDPKPRKRKTESDGQILPPTSLKKFVSWIPCRQDDTANHVPGQTLCR